MNLPAGQVADKIYMPEWIFNLPRATGQPLMSHPANDEADGYLLQNHVQRGQTTMYLVSLESSVKMEENGVNVMQISCILFE